MDKKRLTELALALFVGIIFISSYVSLTNYNTQSATTTIPGTAYAQGLAVVAISGYGSPLYLNVSCSNAALENRTIGIVTSNLTALESNSSVLDFFATGKNISVAAQNMSAYGIYSFITGKVGPNASECIKGYAVAFLSLPPLINVTVGSQGLQVPVPHKYANQSVFTAINKTIGTKLSVKVSMLLTQNGSIYGPLSILPIGVATTSTTTAKTTTTLPSNTTIPGTIPANAPSSNSIPSNSSGSSATPSNNSSAAAGSNTATPSAASNALAPANSVQVSGSK